MSSLLLCGIACATRDNSAHVGVWCVRVGVKMVVGVGVCACGSVGAGVGAEMVAG